MGKTDLHIDWATHAAAKHACEQWHYAKSLPVGKTVKVGAWEAGRFIGVVLFCWGMNKDLGTPYGLKAGECCELVRVALRGHECATSRVLALAMRFLHRCSPGIRLVVSFADPMEGHHGGIYQAANWIYTGISASNYEWRLNGRRLNKRAYTGVQFGKVGSRACVPPKATKVSLPGKHRYIMPLSPEMREYAASLSKPYPKRVKQAKCSDQERSGGAAPTHALHSNAD